jgi:hypothetical protein
VLKTVVELFIEQKGKLYFDFRSNFNANFIGETIEFRHCVMRPYITVIVDPKMMMISTKQIDSEYSVCVDGLYGNLKNFFANEESQFKYERDIGDVHFIFGRIGERAYLSAQCDSFVISEIHKIILWSYESRESHKSYFIRQNHIYRNIQYLILQSPILVNYKLSNQERQTLKDEFINKNTIDGYITYIDGVFIGESVKPA